MLTAPALKALLAAEHLRLKKRLGQHHLVDLSVLEQLLRHWALTRQETVVEIGAGLGALTESLAQQAGRVVALEVDEACCRALTRRLQGASNVTVVCQDVLQFAWERVPGAIVIGAIPYHITSPILVALAQARRTIRVAWLILQQEVGERLLAAPSTKTYGRLSLLAQYHWEVTSVMTIPRRAFFPQPKVDSLCVRLMPWDTSPAAVTDEVQFFDIVKAAFAQRRKTLANCLHAAGWGTRAQIEGVLTSLGLPARVRGEALSLSQFAALTNALSDRAAPL